MTLNETIRWMGERRAGNTRLMDFGSLAEKVADMDIRLRASEALLVLAANTPEDDLRRATLAMEAKIFCTEAASASAMAAADIFASESVRTSSRIGRVVGESQALRIVEGANSAMKARVAHHLFRHLL